MAKKKKPAKAVTKKSAKVAAKKSTLLTAAQIKKACPPEVEQWGNQIIGHYKTACQYENKVGQQMNSIAQYLAKARAACNDGGFAAFRERFCPDFGRSKVYELLQIGSGKKTVEEVKAESRGRKAKQRAKDKAEGKSSVTVTDEVKKLIVGGKLPSNEVDPAASAEQRKIAYAKIVEAEAKPEVVYVKTVEPPVLAPTPTQEQAQANIADLMTEARADGTLLTEEEFIALTKDELRGIFQIISRIFCRLVRFPDGRGIGFYVEEGDATEEVKPVREHGKTYANVIDKPKDVNPAARDKPKAKSAAGRERLDWEALHPQEAKAEALKRAQDKGIKGMSKCDLEQLKAEAKEKKIPWREIKDEKFAEWLAHSWEGSDTEDQFEREFNAEWLGKHGTPHPDDIEGNLLLDIKNADGPYEFPDDEDDVLINAAMNLEATGHIIIDHDSGPKILASYVPNGDEADDEDLINRIRNADELYEVPDGFLEAAFRLKQAGHIKLVYSGSKTYANVIRTQDTSEKKLH